MGKINNYSKDTAVTASDKWVGSDFENNGSTKNFTPTSIAKYLNDNNVINIGSDLRYRYQTLNPGEVRGVGTISFESERGASVAFSGITTFLLSKRTLKQNDVSQYLQFLNGGSIIINSADNQNLFGFYNVVNLSEYALNNDFYSVELQYIAGNGSILEDTDYIFSLIKDKYSSTGKEQVNSDWNSTEGVSEILNKPTSLSEFTNDEGFITIDDVPEVNGIPVGGTTGQILTKASSEDYDAVWQENYADWTSVVKHTVRNNGVEVLLKGRPVYCTGSNGTNKLVGYAGNQSEATSSKTMGLLQSQLNINGSQSTGFVITEGLLGGLNTSSASAGDPVWLGPTGTFIYGLANKPYAPAHLVFIGIVTKVSSGNGEIFVKIQNGFELNEIHDVDLKTTVPINGDLLGFDGTLWVNKTIAEWLGYTPFQLPALTNGSVLFSNGTTLEQDNANLFWDNTNNRLGVGTSSPQQRLHINGSLLAGSSNTSGLFFNIANDSLSISNYRIVVKNAAALLFGNNNSSLSLLTNSLTRLYIDNSGNIAIGATTAGARLDVRAQGALSTDIALRVRDSGDTTNLLSVTGNGRTTIIGGNGDGVNNGVLVVQNTTAWSGFQWIQTWKNSAGTSVASLSAQGGFSTAAAISGLSLTATSGGNTTFRAISVNSTSGFYGSTGMNFVTNNLDRGSFTNDGNFVIGATTAGARLDVRAQGALSTDIAFRVRNSADTGNLVTIDGTGVLTITNQNTSSSISMTSLLASGATGDTYFSVGRALTLNNSALIGHSTVGGGNYAFITVYGRPASDFSVTSTGSIGIGTSLTSASARLQINSTTQGFLPPRMTNAQRLAIASPAIGLIVYCTDMVEGLYVNKSTGWQFII